MFDPIHDIQQAYRELVSAFSFPGTVHTLLPEERDLGFATRLPNAVILLSMILLDGEVTAYFHCTDDEEQSLIQHLTYVRFKDHASADFVFFPHDMSLDMNERKQVLSAVVRGTDQDPHCGATVALCLPQLPCEIDHYVPGPSSTVLELSGPGIETKIFLLFSDNTNSEYSQNLLWWVGPRNTLCEEFPLGIEMILFDTRSRVVVIPRSTYVRPFNCEEGL